MRTEGTAVARIEDAFNGETTCCTDPLHVQPAGVVTSTKNVVEVGARLKILNVPCPVTMNSSGYQ